MALFSKKERVKDDEHAVCRGAYADADTCDPTNFRAEPTIIVTTSTGKHHCWWVFDSEVSAKEASEVSHLIYKAHADQGCDAGWITSKLLRVPGTTNTKYTPHELVTAVYDEVLYTPDTMRDIYKDIALDPTTEELSSDVPKPVTAKRRIELEDELNQHGLSGLYLEVPPEGSDWSDRLFRLELELFRLGMTPKEVFSLAQESACNKYARDNRSELDLWRDVQRAQAEYEIDRHIVTEDSLSSVRRESQAVFLSTEERRFVQEEPTFVDDYTAWVATRSTSDERYQRSCAYVLLSCALGDKGALDLKYGMEPLNLWVMVLGDSTRSHKTTAVKFMTYVLRKLERSVGEVNIGNDASAERLITVLGERDGKVSMLVKEEVSGWFQEMYAKQYRVGSLETFTELYDGTVPRVLRSNKETGNSNHATTIFNFVSVGVRKRVAEVLTRGHFESGFLMRMLWAVADSPPRTKGSYSVHLNDEDDTKPTFDFEQDKLANKLIHARTCWTNTDFVKVGMDADAQNRYNQWIEEAVSYVERVGVADILEAGTVRLGNSVLKSAALLALYEHEDTIRFRHILHAIRQGELWFNDMVRMSFEVSASDFERRLEEFEKYIQSGDENSRLESSVRRKFAKYRQREQDEIVTALLSQGRIRRKPGDQRHYLEAL